CEGCDFSFGPVPVRVELSPAVSGEVTVCPEEQPCRTVEAVDGVASTEVRWQGYMVCRHPELHVSVDAEGCAPADVIVERVVPPEDDPIARVPIALDCG